MAELSRSYIQELDEENMWNHLENFPDHWRVIIEETTDMELSVDDTKIQNICFGGMGGSAIGADLIKAYTYDSSDVPVYVSRHYDIPEWINENTLFIGCSYSGNTEETLSTVEKAAANQAQIIIVTSNGELLKKAQQQDYNYFKIPGGMPPRAALAYSFIPLFRIFQFLELIDEDEQVLEETRSLLHTQMVDLSDLEDNEALTLARKLKNTLPIIYSDATLLDPVHLRWRGQFEENAKTLAYGNNFPEMNHNEIVGWDQIAHLAGRLSVVLLRDQYDHERIKARMDITRDLIQDQTVEIHELTTRGESKLARMFSLIQLADWTSLYLAYLYEVNPTPVTRIDLLKSKLSDLTIQ